MCNCSFVKSASVRLLNILYCTDIGTCEGKIYILFYVPFFIYFSYILTINDLCVNVYSLKMAVCNGRNMLELPLYLN
jgi:hypothetical protein